MQPFAQHMVKVRRPVGRLGSTKPCSGLQPSARFCSATVGAGVNASHCPITCPNRLLPDSLCASLHKVIKDTNISIDKMLSFQ